MDEGLTAPKEAPDSCRRGSHFPNWCDCAVIEMLAGLRAENERLRARRAAVCAACEGRGYSTCGTRDDDPCCDPCYDAYADICDCDQKAPCVHCGPAIDPQLEPGAVWVEMNAPGPDGFVAD